MTRIIIKRDNRTLAQKIFSRESFGWLHLGLAVTAILWSLWLVIGPSMGFSEPTEWEMYNIWKATGIMMSKVIALWVFAYTHKSIREWWDESTLLLNRVFFGCEEDDT